MHLDLSMASVFMATHARLLDRRRCQHLLGEAAPEGTLAALQAYRNPDGGFGWGLEPDLRSSESQTGSALHAFEVFADIAPIKSPHAVELCDWLGSVTLPDGGLPFALPVINPAGCAPFWGERGSSLQISAIVAENAHYVAAHPWLARVTEYCLSAIRELEGQPHALVLAFAVRFLDSVHDTQPEAATLLDRLREYIPENGVPQVEGGAEDEMMRPLDFAPFPDRPTRSLFTPEVVEADLCRSRKPAAARRRLSVDFTSYSSAAALEWRGYATTRAISILKRNGMVR
jgi:hypothetical protein